MNHKFAFESHREFLAVKVSTFIFDNCCFLMASDTQPSWKIHQTPTESPLFTPQLKDFPLYDGNNCAFQILGNCKNECKKLQRPMYTASLMDNCLGFCITVSLPRRREGAFSPQINFLYVYERCWTGFCLRSHIGWENESKCERERGRKKDWIQTYEVSEREA